MPAIVVCEDDPSIRRLMHASLTSMGEIHCAADGEEGLALIMSIHPALVITDLFMPKLDGIALAERMRSVPALADIPVVFMSASLSRVRAIVDSDVRPVAVLRKPFSTGELRSLVARQLSVSVGAV
jgi:CheY-like chemotaxis protein